MLALGPRARIVFAGGWIALQASLVLTGGLRADRVFSFRMFNEASTVRVRLSRVVDVSGAEALVPVDDGEWSARDRDGVAHDVHFDERVIDARFATFDQTIHAAYGVEAHLARLQAALDFVAKNTPNDAETRALVADVRVRKNGRDPYVVRLWSVRR